MLELGDNELMVLFQKGNPHAFELLFEKYRGALFNFICRMLGGQRDAAEDLMQEVFVKIAGARDLYEPRAKFSTWLFAIARNHCINHLRSRRYLQGQATVSLDAATGTGDGPALVDTIPVPNTPADAAERHDLESRLDRCIRALPEAYREVFLLRAVEGLPHQEVADILQLNPATVRTLYLRARQALQKELQDHWKEQTENPFTQKDPP
jgi:RNA polymerase sigma-70 factor (ECF subfamily)